MLELENLNPGQNLLPFGFVFGLADDFLCQQILEPDQPFLNGSFRGIRPLGWKLSIGSYPPQNGEGRGEVEPLHYALSEGRNDIADLLRQHGGLESTGLLKPTRQHHPYLSGFPDLQFSGKIRIIDRMNRMNRIRKEQNDGGWPDPYPVNPVHPVKNVFLGCGVSRAVP